jgi:hypothetical protein
MTAGKGEIESNPLAPELTAADRDGWEIGAFHNTTEVPLPR